MTAPALLLQSLRDDLEQISAAASHDLCDPLREALQYCDQLKSQSDPDAVRLMEAGIKTTLTRIQLLRDYAHLSANEEPFTPFPLSVLLDEIRHQHAEPLKHSGAQIIAGELPTIIGRRRQFAVLLTHLIKNAVRFNDSTTPIITISAEEQPEHWLLSVRDNGDGIEPEFRQLIFGLFRRINPAGAGHGVGLAFCKRIAELHGGHITVESEKGSFTRILIMWPKAPAVPE